MDHPVDTGHGVDHGGAVGDVTDDSLEAQRRAAGHELVASIVGADVEHHHLRALVEQEAHSPRTPDNRPHR